MPQTEAQRVTFHFDPACPWTWRTSRWLVDVTGRHGVEVAWRAFDLSGGAPLESMPEQYRPAMAMSRRFLRAVEAAHAAGDDAVIGEVYAAYGTAVHDEHRAPDEQLLRDAFTDHGGSAYLEALGDDARDADVATARAAAQELAGDDAGSPVLVLHTDAAPRGFFGPVLAPTPTGQDADRLWDAVLAAAAVPAFFELKSRRTAQP